MDDSERVAPVGRRLRDPRLIEKFDAHVAEHGCRDGDTLRCIDAARIWNASWVWVPGIRPETRPDKTNVEVR
jgi:hypothetical protein